MKRDAAEYLTACFSISLNIFIHLFILSLHMTNFQMYAYNKTIFKKLILNILKFDSVHPSIETYQKIIFAFFLSWIVRIRRWFPH